jgi:hypothetical protein
VLIGLAEFYYGALTAAEAGAKSTFALALLVGDAARTAC